MIITINAAQFLVMTLINEWLLFLTAIIFGVYIWSKYHYCYWRRKNIANIEPNIIFGNIKEIVNFSKTATDHLTALYNHEKAEGESVLGIYILNKPALLVRDLSLVKSILVKDFNKFSNRYSASDSHGDPLGANSLFFIKNPQWKEMRTKLTPVFTSGKIKQMFPLVEEIGRELDSFLRDLPMESGSNVQEIKEINALYTTDVIASVAYGVHANSLQNPNGDFRRNGRHVFNFTLWRAFEFTAMFFAPQLVSLFRCKVFSKESTKFIRETISLIMSERMRTGAVRNDLIDILIAFKKEAEGCEAKKHYVMNDDMLIAQAGIFFTAGFETSSATMSFGLYELSKRPELQNRLREEIKHILTKNDGKVTYEAVNKMEYLNMVIQEVLRLYPPLPFLDRVCTLAKDEKEYSLEPYSDFNIPHGMPVLIPIYGIQRDPKYFLNPDEFDPERFSPDNKRNIVPFSYIPFGTGPHNCIGERFALIQTKIGFINFLRNHYVRPCDKSQPTMVLDPRALIIQSKGGIYCKIVRDPLI
ncbi:cytochrome P450 6g1-like [Episyrphus balteatus]|uniref:cytochrome P450 6g1-like n=1 Tax=Episyrphus balteatus TaxID=286459 RepID=UPI002485A648|nr:cytochrome P450 6g1-like [Episyrphus balteatus]